MTTGNPEELLTADRINPLVDPEQPLETMARVSAVLGTLGAILESMPEAASHCESGGVPLILECCICALDLAHDVGRADGSMPPLGVWREG